MIYLLVIMLAINLVQFLYNNALSTTIENLRIKLELEQAANFVERNKKV